MPHSDPNITSLLQSAGSGDREASDELLRVLLDELRQLAQAKLMRLPSNHTLQPTALVNEVYLRLVDLDQLAEQGRRDFMRTAARAMQDVLVETARRRSALKRGAHWQRIDVSHTQLAAEVDADEFLALDEALEELAVHDARKAEIVRLRFFVGLSEAEIGEALDVSLSTVRRDWSFARSWLKKELRRRTGKREQ